MILLIICLLVIPFITGSWSLRLRKQKAESYLVEIYMMGLLFLFTLYEIIGCVIIRKNNSFAEYVACIVYGTAGATVISLLCNFRLLRTMAGRWLEQFRLQRAEPKGKKKTAHNVLIGAIVFLILLQILAIILFVPDIGGDTSVETVYATLESGSIFTHNPVTGEEMINGIYPYHKLTSLPILYGAMAKIFHVAVWDLLFLATPVWVLLLHLWILSGFGLSFFRKAREERNIFLLLYEVTIITGCLASGTFSDNLLFGGWKGILVAQAILLPFLFLVLHRMIEEKEKWYGITGLAMGIVGIVFTRPIFLPQLTGYLTEKILSRFGLFLMAIIAYYLVMEKTKKRWKKQEIGIVLICLLLAFFPETAAAAMGISIIGALLHRIAVQRARGRRALAGFLILIWLTGTVAPFGGAAVTKDSLNEGDLKANGAILELAEEKGRIELIAPDQIMEYARLSDQRVHLIYGKDLWIQGCNLEVADLYTEEEVFLHGQMSTDYMQPDAIAAMAGDTGCNVLVLREKMEDNIAVQHGYTLWRQVADYVIYTRFSG